MRKVDTTQNPANWREVELYCTVLSSKTYWSIYSTTVYCWSICAYKVSSIECGAVGKEEFDCQSNCCSQTQALHFLSRFRCCQYEPKLVPPVSLPKITLTNTHLYGWVLKFWAPSILNKIYGTIQWNKKSQFNETLRRSQIWSRHWSHKWF